MYVFKCKMCGAPMDLENSQKVCECKYCGVVQTVPVFRNDSKANLYDRANHLRRNGEFDKAEGIYELILSEDSEDAESYWSLVLCRYGIEYVEDPQTKKRIPTINRLQYTSILEDVDYQNTLKYAKDEQKPIYQEEARVISEIQKGILEISSKENDFDVFISYKESDENGNRTQDSVLAYDIYEKLTNEGLKVFFSRVTLEDKLGSAYEPYIFAALNSAKVMVVLGTKEEYFNAVWLRNEWSRYLNIIKESNGSKSLIPVYKNMDPYDLPKEFAHLQAQDMGKLGFMQDLIRGIKKIIASTEEDKKQESFPNINGSGNVESILKRAEIAASDYDFTQAAEYYERVLNMDARNAKAYLGEFVCAHHMKNLQEFVEKNIETLSHPPVSGKKSEIACPENVDKVNELVAKYELPPALSRREIEQAVSFSRKYDSYVEYFENYLTDMEDLFSTDNNIRYALRFANEDLKAEILDAKDKLITAIKERIETARKEEVENKERIIKKYQDLLESADEELKLRYESTSKEYEKENQKRIVAEKKKRGRVAIIVSVVLLLLIIFGTVFGISTVKMEKRRAEDCVQMAEKLKGQVFHTENEGRYSDIIRFSEDGKTFVVIWGGSSRQPETYEYTLDVQSIGFKYTINYEKGSFDLIKKDPDPENTRYWLRYDKGYYYNFVLD